MTKPEFPRRGQELGEVKRERSSETADAYIANLPRVARYRLGQPDLMVRGMESLLLELYRTRGAKDVMSLMNIGDLAEGEEDESKDYERVLAIDPESAAEVLITIARDKRDSFQASSDKQNFSDAVACLELAWRWAVSIKANRIDDGLGHVWPKIAREYAKLGMYKTVNQFASGERIWVADNYLKDVIREMVNQGDDPEAVEEAVKVAEMSSTGSQVTLYGHVALNLIRQGRMKEADRVESELIGDNMVGKYVAEQGRIAYFSENGRKDDANESLLRAAKLVETPGFRNRAAHFVELVEYAEEMDPDQSISPEMISRINDPFFRLEVYHERTKRKHRKILELERGGIGKGEEGKSNSQQAVDVISQFRELLARVKGRLDYDEMVKLDENGADDVSRTLNKLNFVEILIEQSEHVAAYELLSDISNTNGFRPKDMRHDDSVGVFLRIARYYLALGSNN